MNNFPAMTEEQWRQLIESCQLEIKQNPHSPHAQMAKIALAALTVEPVGWMVKYGGIDKEMFVDKQAAARLYHDVTENGFLDVDMLQLYTVPPAPVLRLPDEAETTNLPFAAMGWNACLAEVKRLNSQPAPTEASNEQ